MRRYDQAALAALSGLLLLAGGLLYIAFRSEQLLMFEWFAWLGMSPALAVIRQTAQPLKSGLPCWVYLSLPNALPIR